MKKIELSAKYKIFMYLFVSLIVVLLSFIAFLVCAMILDINIEMSQEDYYIAFGILGVLILVCLSMPFIIFRKAFYDKENRCIVLISYFGIKRTLHIESSEGYATVYLTKAEDKEKCTVNLNINDRFILTIVTPKNTYKEDILDLGITEIDTL